ncbi:hypothetical protein GPECTOR_43g906 [Gonium pectorale]|uniref:B30.2/SPRY domain-containing protein n=1 Tax=Gonium pectorale TaxID=33097 RepID=A0A150GAT8_GONPE|nr:hypothetical protein GPECTOR_43g906 [Gonium pectorale]|eukprot:KXZ46470.1 hypothetical protein GPECTOR_43g906 [Gonium pectorale]
MTHLKVDGARIRYVGPGTDDSHAATVRANYPLPSDVPLYYFEVKVLDRGRDGFIGVGFCTAEVLLSKLPGWDSHSYGYHGDDGNAFSGSGMGRPYGPGFTAGDVVGALYDRSDNSISYYKNGEPLGVAFRDVAEASPLFPCVGLRTRGEEVTANFGVGPASEPFRTDFAAIKAAYQRRVMDSVRGIQLPLLSSRGTALLPQLMYDYLLHQRYWRTAAVLGRDLLRGSTAGALDEQELSDIAVRQESYDMVASGRIDEALALLREKYPPKLLSERPSLDFRLHLQKFVEMVAAVNAAAASTAPEADAATAGPGSAVMDTRRPEEEATTHGSAEAEAEAGASPTSSPGAGGTAGIDGGTLGRDDAKAGRKGSGDGGGKEGGGTGEGSAAGRPPVPTTAEILAYGSAELMPRCRTASDRDLLTDALSLLAFNDPAASPAGYLMRPAHRIALAEELNGSLLAVRGLPATSPLERLYQQAAAAMTELKRGDHPQVVSGEALALPDPRILALEPAAGGGGGGGSGSGAGGSGGSGELGGGDPMMG